jgi:hypothetical protein
MQIIGRNPRTCCYNNLLPADCNHGTLPIIYCTWALQVTSSSNPCAKYICSKTSVNLEQILINWSSSITTDTDKSAAFPSSNPKSSLQWPLHYRSPEEENLAPPLRQNFQWREEGGFHHERVNTPPTTPPVRGPDWHPAPFAPLATCSTHSWLRLDKMTRGHGPFLGAAGEAEAYRARHLELRSFGRDLHGL